MNEWSLFGYIFDTDGRNKLIKFSFLNFNWCEKLIEVVSFLIKKKSHIWFNFRRDPSQGEIEHLIIYD